MNNVLLDVYCVCFLSNCGTVLTNVQSQYIKIINNSILVSEFVQISKTTRIKHRNKKKTRFHKLYVYVCSSDGDGSTEKSKYSYGEKKKQSK